MKVRGKQVKGLPEYYVDDVKQMNVQKRGYNLTIAGGDGRASKFLTSDGLTKSGSNTFLFSSVFNGGGFMKTIQSDTEAATCCGFTYNTGTGLAEWKFMESNTSSIGALGGTAEGLEDEENGSTVFCFVEGI